MADVQLKNVYKSFGDTEVLHGVDLEVNDNEFAVFVGPSGCGKSTLLRLIAGLGGLDRRRDFHQQRACGASTTR